MLWQRSGDPPRNAEGITLEEETGAAPNLVASCSGQATKHQALALLGDTAGRITAAGGEKTNKHTITAGVGRGRRGRTRREGAAAPGGGRLAICGVSGHSSRLSREAAEAGS